MVDTTAVRNRIEARVFSALGSTALYSSLITGTTNTHGDTDKTWSTGVSTTFVPWSLMYSQESFHQFGDLHIGELDAAFKYTQQLNIDDKIVFDTKTYLVKNVENFTIKDVTLVKVARLKESL